MVQVPDDLSTCEPTFLAYMGLAPSPIPHWEHWSCPDAESYLAGIDYYDHPRECRLKLKELYPQLGLGVPESDEPIPRPKLGHDADQDSSDPDAHAVRWGASTTATFEHGEKFFATADDVFAFSPLAQGDFRDWPVVNNMDFSDEEKLYAEFRSGFPAEWGDTAPEGVAVSSGFYNTMFMWPMLTFGWELFLECCLDARFERIMDEFAEINRRVFRSLAKLPVNFLICHDDIVTSRGPVCSPQWMHKYIFPRYEEFWGMARATGKEVIFMVDGCVDACAEDVLACGARGIISEPMTNYKAIARRHPDENLFLAGEGDNRILTRNNTDEIKAMVDSMIETSNMTGGYMMCIGNHIPWNVTPAGIKTYLDYSAERTAR
ncbi:MAG: uroporphyrinogen decarboxylase family protein [Planctomycetota bacterium]